MSADPIAVAKRAWMFRLIASARPQDYLAAMASAALRLLALFALVLMPMAMNSAPASAQPDATAPAGHCDDHQQPAKAPAGSQVHCTACAALPAIDTPAPVAELDPETPMIIALAGFLSGIEPDTATPPPKLA